MKIHFHLVKDTFSHCKHYVKRVEITPEELELLKQLVDNNLDNLGDMADDGSLKPAIKWQKTLLKKLEELK